MNCGLAGARQRLQRESANAIDPCECGGRDRSNERCFAAATVGARAH
jgi:hypothetical protein